MLNGSISQWVILRMIFQLIAKEIAKPEILGWYFVGPTARINPRNGSLTCNRFTVREARNNKIADHDFVVEEQ